MLHELTFADCSHTRDPIVGCALEGVANILAGIRDASIVLHSPQGCSATAALGYDNHEIDFTRRKLACTRLFECDIIMGAADKLKELILQVAETFQTRVIFVVGTCSADIIGEDIEGICRVMQPRVQSRLIAVHAGGFRGDFYSGMDLGLDSLLSLVKERSQPPAGRKVNLVAPQANQNPSWWADLEWVRGVLAAMQVDVQSVLAKDTSLEEIAEASQAGATLLLSHDSGHGFVRNLEDKFHVPSLLAGHPLPIGLGNTARWLRALGEHFGAREVAEKMIQQGEERVITILRRRGLMIIPRYRNCKVAISADATFGIGLLRMLYEELEMIPELLLLRSGSPAARSLLETELQSLGLSPKVVFGTDGYTVKRALQESKVDAVFGSAWEKYLAAELGIKVAFDLFSPTNNGRYLDRAYFGYEGMLNMMEIAGNDWETAFRSKQIVWRSLDRETASATAE